jgi:hypothetical protein
MWALPLPQVVPWPKSHDLDGFLIVKDRPFGLVTETGVRLSAAG